LRFVGIDREENLALEFFAGADALTQLRHLFCNEILNLVRLSNCFSHGEIGVLSRQCSQEGAHRGGVAMRQHEFRISRIELERMARLTVGNEGDALIIATLGIGLVAVVAVKLLAVHERYVGRKVALMIKAQPVWIANLVPVELKLRMAVPK